MLGWTNFQTVDKIAGSATLLSGQIGAVGGIRVVVSQAMGDAVGDACAVIVNTRNYIVGNLRNTLTENDTDVENQKRIIVTTRRFGFSALDKVSANVGQGVAKIVLAT
jgi:hypothetical protein